jgi:chemotaxis signal transduction protein
MSLQVDCDVLCFEVGGQEFGADPLDVTQVARARDDARIAQVLPPRDPRPRLLWVAEGDGFGVPIDRVMGLRRVPAGELRAAPPLLKVLWGSAADLILGLLLQGDRSPLLVLNLKALSVRAKLPAPGKHSHG